MSWPSRVLACAEKSDDDKADIETASSGDAKEIDPDFINRKHVKREHASASVVMRKKVIRILELVSA
jgi:hypothetical protein